MPTDVHWGCHECKHYKKCKIEYGINPWDLCPEWEPMEDE